jgi:hypothetical protein
MGGTWFSFYFHSALPSFPSWFLPSPLSSLFPLRGIARELPKKFSDDSRKDIQPQSRYLRVSRLSRIFTLQDRPFAQASIKDMHPAEESINVCLDRDTSIERKRARNVYPESRRLRSSRIYIDLRRSGERQGSGTPLCRFDPPNCVLELDLLRNPGRFQRRIIDKARDRLKASSQSCV